MVARLCRLMGEIENVQCNGKFFINLSEALSEFLTDFLMGLSLIEIS